MYTESGEGATEYAGAGKLRPNCTQKGKSIMSKGKTAEEYVFINPSIWEDAKFYKMPELPTIELKKDKDKYKITD